ncbi:hypothetical protein [Flavobacterium selenitireducens]|uniref:hypothetical protein n=1 Tax=Flavobacterium selenitireducens TaxID=2722704 RepID=UPI00168BC99E|nr:hypothetical protein [Flavobacterium selenitireducens]MBD3581680.1 hypothetical protein [Flavobacterium selenitireducens]
MTAVTANIIVFLRSIFPLPAARFFKPTYFCKAALPASLVAVIAAQKKQVFSKGCPLASGLGSGTRKTNRRSVATIH